jgi:hypothetical protein
MDNPALLRIIRKIRLFDPKDYVHRQRYVVYSGVFACIAVAGNVMQYRRMRKLYPDYNEVARTQGAMYAGAKAQELADVQRYNNMVKSMRTDIGTSGRR